MENHQYHHSSAAPPNAKGSSGSGSGCPENKDVVVLNSSAVVVTATIAASNDGDGDVSKGKSVVAADNKDKELEPHIVTERKRRDRMRDYYAELKAIVPEIPAKSDKTTIVEHTIGYIQSLEKTMAMLEQRKQLVALARRQAATAEGVASSPSAPPPQAAQGAAVAPVAAMSDILDACSDALPLPLQPAVPTPPAPQPPLAGAEPAPPPQFPVTARRVGFQTWSWPDHLVLTVSNDNAYLSVCVPRQRHRGVRTMVMVLSVLNKYGIEVDTAQLDADAVRSVFNIYARVAAMGGENRSAVEVYQLAVSEILVWLTTS